MTHLNYSFNSGHSASQIKVISLPDPCEATLTNDLSSVKWPDSNSTLSLRYSYKQKLNVWKNKPHRSSWKIQWLTRSATKLFGNASVCHHDNRLIFGLLVLGAHSHGSKTCLFRFYNNFISKIHCFFFLYCHLPGLQEVHLFDFIVLLSVCTRCIQHGNF